MSKAITDTSRAECNPSWLFGGNPRAIEDQESRGQREMVNSDQLPIRISPSSGRGKLEEAGVKFLPCGTDEVFRAVVLPVGWKKIATDHPMWSRLVDDKGVVRAKIFYKAAFYDRNASMIVEMDV